MAILERGESIKIEALDELLAFKEARLPVEDISPTGKKTEREIVIRWGPSLLGYDTPTIIAPQREGRPDYGDKPIISRKEFWQLLHRYAGALPVDPMAGTTDLHQQILKANLKEIRRQLQSSKDGCPFCPANLERQIKANESGYATLHKDIDGSPLLTDLGAQVISIPNAMRYLPQGSVTVFEDHYPGIGNLTLRGLANYYKTGHQMASTFRAGGYAGVLDFSNMGFDAGASVLHAHGQRGSVPEELFYLFSPRARIIQRLMRFGVIPDGNGVMDRLIGYIKENHPELVICDKDLIFAYAVWAPKALNHVEVIFRNGGNLGNLLDFSPHQLEVAGSSTAGIYHSLEGMGTTDVNTVLHQAPFDNRIGMRMQAEIYQRNGRTLGAGESSGIFNVITTSPEKTAEVAKAHYSKPLILNHHPQLLLPA